MNSYHSLTSRQQGHELILRCQNQVGDLEFDWVRQYGNVFRMQGIWGVNCPLQLVALIPVVIVQSDSLGGYAYGS